MRLRVCTTKTPCTYTNYVRTLLLYIHTVRTDKYCPYAQKMYAQIPVRTKFHLYVNKLTGIKVFGLFRSTQANQFEHRAVN